MRTSLQQMQRGTPTSISPKRVPSSAPGPLESSNPCRPQKLRLESKACLTRKGSRKRSRATLPPTRRIATFIPPHTSNFRVLPTNISSYAPVPLDADIEICKLRFRPWRPCPTRSTRLCRTSSSRSAKPRFSMASFCAAIPPTNCAATFVSPPRCLPSGIANRSASLSFVQFWNASSNIASTSWPFSKISSATIPLRNVCNSFLKPQHLSQLIALTCVWAKKMPKIVRRHRPFSSSLPIHSARIRYYTTITNTSAPP